jgi:hypothetical protein
VRHVAAVALGASLLLLADPAARASTATAPVSAVSEIAGPPDIVLIVTDDQRWDTLWAMPILSLVADPAMRPVLDDRRTRLRELCSPAPPGFGDRSGTSVPIALAVLGGLVLVESLASRRTRRPRRAPG